MVAEMEWQAEALSLKEQGLSSAEIADAVGKHPATVRKVLARASTKPEPSSNGNGHGPIDAETAARLRDAATGDGDPPAGPIPGQIDIGGNEVMGGGLPSGPEEEKDPTPRYDRAAFEAEAGEAVGPMPPREMDGGEVTHAEEIRVDGSTQLALDCGGRLADDGTLTLAGAVHVDGFYRKGDRIYGTFEAVVTGVAVKDKLDKKTGVIQDTGQNHVAKVTSLVVNGWRN